MWFFNTLLLTGSFFLARPALAQVNQPPAMQLAATPSQAYQKLAADCCQLLRKANALPDAQGVALLRQQVPPLQARAKPVVRAFANRLKAMPPARQEAESERIMHSGFGKELERTMASLGPQSKHSRAFTQQVATLMESMSEGL